MIDIQSLVLLKKEASNLLKLKKKKNCDLTRNQQILFMSELISTTQENNIHDKGNKAHTNHTFMEHNTTLFSY